MVLVDIRKASILPQPWIVTYPAFAGIAM